MDPKHSYISIQQQIENDLQGIDPDRRVCEMNDKPYTVPTQYQSIYEEEKAKLPELNTKYYPH